MPKFSTLFLTVLLGAMISGSVSFAGSKPQWLMVSGKMMARGSLVTSVYGEFIVDYYDENLPWGAEVEIHYGFSRSEFRNGELTQIATWQDAQVEKVSAIGPYKWGKKIFKRLYFRGSWGQLTKLDFYLVVSLPNGEKQFIPDSVSGEKYYSVIRPLEQEGCNPWGELYCSLSMDQN